MFRLLDFYWPFSKFTVRTRATCAGLTRHGRDAGLRLHATGRAWGGERDGGEGDEGREEYDEDISTTRNRVLR